MGIILISLPVWLSPAQNSYQPTQQDSVQTLEIETPKAEHRPIQKVRVSPGNLKDFLKSLSVTYGIDYDEIYSTIDCESKFDSEAYNPTKTKLGHSYGVGQFMTPSWEWFNKMRGTNMDYMNPYDQLDMAAWLFSKGYQSQWDCAKILGIVE